MSRNNGQPGSYIGGVLASIVGVVAAGVAYRVAYDGTASLFRDPPPANTAPAGPPGPRSRAAAPPVAPQPEQPNGEGPKLPPRPEPPKLTFPPRPAPPVEPKKEEPVKIDLAARPFAVDPQAKAAGKTLYLAVRTPFAYQTGPWRLGIGEKGDDGKRPIVLQKKEYKYGVSMHPPRTDACRVSFAPGKEFTRFKGSAGIGDGMNPFGTTVFAVYGDGRKLWESDGVNKSGAAGAFDINVTGVEVLTLETRIKDGSYTGAHAVWLDPWLER